MTRRLDHTTANRSGVAAMEARVQVLSIAYREALSEGRMQDVRIRQFAEEIVDSLSQSFKRPGVLLELKADVQAALMVDRAIPFGLALVESVMAGLDAEAAHAVIVRIGELDDMRVELRVASEPPVARRQAQCTADGGTCLAACRDRREPGHGYDHSMAVSDRAAARSNFKTRGRVPRARIGGSKV